MSRATFYPTAGGDCPRGAPPFRPEGYWATVKWASDLVGAETRRAIAAEAEIARSVPVLDDSVTEGSANGVKSSGVWAFAKGLLPAWLVPGYEEPASAESVASAVQSVSEALGDHAADTVAHVTEGDRAEWNDKYTKREVDDKITRFAAHYLTDRVDGRFVPFATRARLAEAEARHTAENPGFFYAGEGFTPTKNDYCVVLSDETFGGKTTRYSFVGAWGEDGRWQYQYTVNDTAFSEEQWAAINSTTSVDGDGNLCFAGIPIVASDGKLVGLTGEDIPVSSTDSAKVSDAISAKRGLTDFDVDGGFGDWQIVGTGAEHYRIVYNSALRRYEWQVKSGPAEGTVDRVEASELDDKTRLEFSGMVATRSAVSAKIARTAELTAGGLAKFGADGVLEKATASSAGGEAADYRDPTDNVCHRDSVGGEWTFSDGQEHALTWNESSTQGPGYYSDEGGRTGFADENYSGFAVKDAVSCYFNDTEVVYAAARRRVATKDHAFVTDDIAARSLECGDGDAKQTVTVENGIAKLDDFFTASNGALVKTIEDKGTAPDAHIEAPTTKRMKVVLADGSIAYDSDNALPYEFSQTVGDRTFVSMVLTAASTDITLPTISADDAAAKDFIVEAKNEYAVEGVATDVGINVPRTDFKLVCRDGESLSDVTTVRAGKTALICFTQKSPVVVDGVTYPCWFVQNVPEGDPS